MPLTLLEIIQQAQGELGLPEAAYVVGNADATTHQMFRLANRVLDEMRKMNRWTAQQFEYDLVVSTPVITTGNVDAATPNVIYNIPSTAGILANYFMVSANSFPSATRVISVDSPSQVTLSMEATITSNLVGTPVTFARDTYPVPPNFDWFNNRTMWDRTNRWELLGPDSPQTDQWHRSGIVALGPRRHFRKLGAFSSTFRIWPPPIEIVSPLQLVFEYLSLDAVMVNGSNSNFAQYFTNDLDEPTLPDNAIVTGIEWMFWQRKGFGYIEMKNDWIDYVNREIARDGAAPTLGLVKRWNSLLISPYQIADGYFPGNTTANTG